MFPLAVMWDCINSPLLLSWVVKLLVLPVSDIIDMISEPTCNEFTPLTFNPPVIVMCWTSAISPAIVKSFPSNESFASAVKVPSPSVVNTLSFVSDAITSVKSKFIVLAAEPSNVCPPEPLP